MKNQNRMAMAVLLLSMAAWQCGEDADGITGNEQLSGLRAQSASLLADGVSQITLVATVLDSSGYPLQGSQVAFTTSIGSITSKAYTNLVGEAQALLTSVASETDLTVTVTARIMPAENGRVAGAIAVLESQLKDGSRQANLQKSTGTNGVESSMQIPLLGITMTAQIDPNELCADGLSRALLRVSLKETSSKKGISAALVQARGAKLAILEDAETDAKGSAEISVTSVTKAATDTLYVEYGNLIRRFVLLSMRAPRLSLRPDKADLLADGASMLSFSAVLFSHTNNPIAGADIQFRCDEGIITGTVQTSASGEAVAQMRGGQVARSGVKVIAQFHEWADTAIVNMVDSAPSLLSISAGREILRNGIDETRVQVTLLNTMQRPVPGTRIRFSTSAGVIDSVAVTDGAGEASVMLRSDAGEADLSAALTARVNGLTARTVVLFQGLTLQLSASPSSLPADGLSTSNLSIYLKKTVTHQAIGSAFLQMSTTLGTLPAAVTTDASGMAQTVFKAGTLAGTSVITARYGDLERQTEVMTTLNKPAGLQISVEPNYIWVTETGQPDQCQIYATIIGPNGLPFQEEVRVKFLLRNGPNGGEMLLPNDGNPRESTVQKSTAGRAKIACKAGTRSGAVEIQAFLVDYPDLMARSTQITLRSGPPYIWIDPANPNNVSSHMTVALDYFNLEGWNHVREFKVTVYVGDKYNNPVEEGTTLYLTSTAGIVTTNTRTDADGRGTAIWTTANPRPAIAPSDPTSLAPHRIPNPNSPEQVLNVTLPDFEGSLVRNSIGTLTENDGIGLVMCTTHGRDQAGQDAVVFNMNSAVFSGPILVFSAVSDKANLRPGESAIIQVRVYDINGNPAAKGSTLSVTTNAGRISDTDLMANAERYGYGATYFVTSLLNTLDPLKDESKMAEVTFRLDSPNGTGVRTVPIYLFNL